MPKREEKSRPNPRKVRNSLAVYVDKQRIVFGNYDDPVAWKKYSEFCEKRQSGENETPVSSEPPALGGCPPNAVAVHTPGKPALVGELVTRFLESAQETKNPSDFSNYKTAGQALWQYKSLPTAEFDAYLLLQVQGEFVKAGYARTHCNKLVNFCIHIFKWGEVRRLVPPGKNKELQAVEPLRSGTARETEDRIPVDNAWWNALWSTFCRSIRHSSVLCGQREHVRAKFAA